MATKTTTDNPQSKLQELRTKIAAVRLEIRAGKTKNTNAHKALKKELAQTLTKINQNL
jgi:ribosomal protein L29